MKDLENFIASIKQFITGTANNIKTILDKKFKGVGLVEVSTETIRTDGDINIKLKNIPSENLIGNASGASATPTSFGIGDGLEFNAGKLRTEVGELSDIENSTTGQKSWSGDVLRNALQSQIGFARFGSQMTGLGRVSPQNPVPGVLDIIFKSNIGYTIESYQDGNSIKILEAGYYEITAGYTTDFYSQVECYVDIFTPPQGAIYNSNRVSAGASKFTGGVTASTGVVYIEANGIVRMEVDIRGGEDITASVFMTIKKIG